MEGLKMFDKFTRNCNSIILVIKESKDISTLTIKELIGSVKSHEWKLL